ncbi:hypothetical protein NEOLEDRAFT_1243914 [Neolentinus lepideus HHB14362 ss-1]|uniref:Uncharacterized protein n=1 Tax=Neolentinus lepideus HHB14362 ss-1 TaxID=1314782 RepID=A0A165QJX7_9AGAM|nr:hypothetical protein NEOLEDRAFT_1243914 [Neolentinus lepideus HHB14362 ss-1]
MKQVRRFKAKPYFRFIDILRSGPAPPAVTRLDVSSVPDAKYTEPLRRDIDESELMLPLRRALSDSDAPAKKKSKGSKTVRFAEEPEIRYFSCPTPSVSWAPLCVPELPEPARDENRTPWLSLDFEDPLADIPAQYIRGRTVPFGEDDLIYETGEPETEKETTVLSASCATSSPIAIPQRDRGYQCDPSWLSSTLKEFDASGMLQIRDFEPVAPRSYHTGQPFSSRNCNSGPIRSVTY